MAIRKHKNKSTNKGNFPKHPARVLIEVSPHRTTGGSFIEGLTPYPAEHESYIERYAVPTLALCHDVHAIESQSSRDQYIDSKNEEHSYTQDFVVSTFVPRLVIECKALKSLLHKESLEKYQDIARHYLRNKQPFAFLVDAQLVEEPRFSSVKLLFRYVTSSIPIQIIDRANQALVDGPVTIRQLLLSTKLELVDVYTLIAKRHLSFDWSATLDIDASVSRISQPFEGLKLENILRSTRFYPVLEDLAMGRGPTDKQLMEDAKNWGQLNRELSPYSFVGGFPKTRPLRDLTETECSDRKPWSRGDFSICSPVIKNHVE